jgi:hypothetical protein
VLCPSCSKELQPGQTVCPFCRLELPPPAYHPPLSNVRGLGLAVAALLIMVGLCYLVSSLLPEDDTIAGILRLAAPLLLLPLGPAFITWFFMVRRNAERWGPQRRRAAWAIAGWLVPPVLLWFPYQIASDAWRTSRPPVDAGLIRTRLVVVGWWICWLLAWFTGFYRFDTVGVRPNGTTVSNTAIGFSLGATVVSGVFAGAAGLLGALMVVTISRWQQARIPEG